MQKKLVQETAANLDEGIADIRELSFSSSIKTIR